MCWCLNRICDYSRNNNNNINTFFAGLFSYIITFNFHSNHITELLLSFNAYQKVEVARLWKPHSYKTGAKIWTLSDLKQNHFNVTNNRNCPWNEWAFSDSGIGLAPLSEPSCQQWISTGKRLGHVQSVLEQSRVIRKRQCGRVALEVERETGISGPVSVLPF